MQTKHKVRNMNEIIQYAELFKLIANEFDGAYLGKKVSQKMFYFFERKGLSLNLRYGIHYYGPYSAKLDNIMHILESKDYISIDTSGQTHIISLGSQPIDDDSIQLADLEIAKGVVSLLKHKSPLELEALATLDYISNSILPAGSDTKSITKMFKEIKGSKFDDNIISSSFKSLKQLNLN